MADNTAFSLLKQRSTGSSRVVFAHPGENQNTRPNANIARSLYIHIPFCSHKCHYCDFYSIVDRQDRQSQFTDRLVRELQAQAPYIQGTPLRSIFVGGGTPSLLDPDLWKTLLQAIEHYFDMSLIKSGQGEFSVECNPESVSAQLADTLVAGGVNRASMGAQSFNPKYLKVLERKHDPDRVVDSMNILQAAGIKRTSIDLIYAIPNQTITDWDHDLQTALTLPIEHISAYGLTYEPGTAMTARLAKGEFTQAPDELEALMYNHALDTLRSRGFERYEVSNHALPNAQCQHNLAYWRGEEWLAVGPSASGHFRGARWKNTPRLDDYLQHDDAGFAPLCDYEPPDQRRSLMDLLMTSIRLREGVNSKHALMISKSLNVDEPLQQAINECHSQGWIHDPNAEYWTLTDEGFLFADHVARECIGAVME